MKLDSSLKKRGSIDIWINNAGQNTPHMYVWEIGETYTENNAQITRLTNRKAALRFMTAGSRKVRLI